LHADLDSLVERLPAIVTEPGHLTGELWLHTARLFDEGGLPWLEMYASRRAAEALLSGSRQSRTEGWRAL
jgi:hypothetical protein